jgi:gliding motility-associatede transport system auxiliary component
MKRKEVKKQNIIQFSLLIVIIILLNYISNFLFFRVDLTSDKRYIISETTKKYISELEDVVYFQIYLDGDLPYGFQKLQRSAKELLEEFRAYGGDNIEFEFYNPSANPDQQTRNEIFKQLYDKGLQPTNLQVKGKDGAQSQQIIFPGMVINYRARENVLNILENNSIYSPEVNLNNSIQNLEYEIITAIKSLTYPFKEEIAFIDGHRELEEVYVDDINFTLGENYSVSRIKINGQLDALQGIDLIIIAKPDSTVDEKDKFVIDQFVMNGGKILWLVDNIKADMDSLAYTSSTLAITQQMNLEDILFKYGVRINYNIIQDMQCAFIPVNMAIQGAQPQFAPAPWVYFPLLSPQNTHPISKNINLVKTEFASVIDTVGNNPEIEKTILLSSSAYSKTVRAPLRIGLEIVNEELDAKRFPKSNLPIAVLLEGEFESVFKNRLTSTLLESDEIDFKEKSEENKMIVIADGDIIKNQVRKSGDQIIPFPLGYDRFTQQTYGNKDFLINCINYLLDDSGVMDIRKKEVTLRLLDKQKTNTNHLFWQLINIFFPLIIIILFGAIWFYIRKKKYTN